MTRLKFLGTLFIPFLPHKKKPAVPAPAEPDHFEDFVPPGVETQRLEFVTWDPVHQLFGFEVSEGVISVDDEGHSRYTKVRTRNYSMNFKFSRMTATGEHAEYRSYEPVESAIVGEILGVVERYAMASARWWELGGGTDDVPGTVNRSKLSWLRNRWLADGVDKLGQLGQLVPEANGVGLFIRARRKL